MVDIPQVEQNHCMTMLAAVAIARTSILKPKTYRFLRARTGIQLCIGFPVVAAAVDQPQSFHIASATIIVESFGKDELMIRFKVQPWGRYHWTVPG